MEHGIKVTYDKLRTGMTYKIVYKGRPGGDFGSVGGLTLRYRYITQSGIPRPLYSINFLEVGKNAEEARRYALPVFRADFSDVDQNYDFYQTYTGPMAAGEGPESGVMPEIRRAPAPAPARAQAAPRGNAPIGGRRKARKTRRSRRRGSRKVRR